MSQACTKSADLILVQRRDGCDRCREHDRSQRTRSRHHPGHAGKRSAGKLLFFSLKLVFVPNFVLRSLFGARAIISQPAMFAMVMAVA